MYLDKTVLMFNQFLQSQFLRSIGATTHDKYVRLCLKAIFTDKAACDFSWHGMHGNIPVKSFTVINILKGILLFIISN